MMIPTENNPKYNFDLAKVKFLRALKMTLHAVTTNNSDPDKGVDLSRQTFRSSSKAPVDVLDSLLRRFHTVASQLQQRHDGRDSLLIKDEYDVQDLLHALLWIQFEDVRREDSLPSTAGGGSRLDFLLYNEKIGVEVKMATGALTDKKLGDQLIIDIERYREHQNCKTLVFFIYNPNNVLKNPAGLTNDLSQDDGKIIVKVIIVP